MCGGTCGLWTARPTTQKTMSHACGAASHGNSVTIPKITKREPMGCLELTRIRQVNRIPSIMQERFIHKCYLCGCSAFQNGEIYEATKQCGYLCRYRYWK